MPANQAGKGPQPRAYDTSALNAGHERIFGKKKPWWEERDERAKDDLSTAEVAPPDPEPYNPYQVPLVQDPYFGERLQLPAHLGLLIVMHRDYHGWRTPETMPFARLMGQVYTAELPVTASKEIAVVGLNTGKWVTVWASSPSEISHPYKS